MAPPDPALQRLAEAPLFQHVDRELVDGLLRSAQPLAVADQHAVFARGDPVRYLYFVRQGRVKISTLSEAGKSFVVEVFQDGDVFGEITAVDGGERTADATALGPVSLYAVSAEAFRTALAQSPVLSLNLLRITVARLRRTYALLEDTTFFDLETRLAKQLLYLKNLGATATPAGTRIAMRVRQEDLADLLGATTRRIISILNDWREAGIAVLDSRSGFVTILDEARFQAIAAA